MRKEIEKLLESKVSTSAIAKGANLPWSTVADLRSGKTNMDKMSLLTAEKLYKYAKEEELEMKKNKKSQTLSKKWIQSQICLTFGKTKMATSASKVVEWLQPTKKNLI